MTNTEKRGDRILSIGEILWDLLPGGKKVGGAPANFAYHCQQLGGDVRLVSRVGRDPLGDELLEYCDRLDLNTELVGRDRSAPTGTVSVHLGPDGQPTYTIEENVAWDFLEATPDAVRWASESDAIGFGSLAARSEPNRETLKTLVAHAPEAALRVLDLNLRDPFCERKNIEFVLSCANILKLNDEELARVVRMFGVREGSTEELLRRLRELFQFRLVILTCGADGSWLTSETEQIFTPGIDVEVADTVGAGDSFTAATVIGLLRGKPLAEIALRASELGAYVCSQPGGTPLIPERLLYQD